MPQTNKGQIMDVASPGKSAASPTTRPVVTNNSAVQDPTVKDAGAEQTEEPPKVPLSTHTKVISPLEPSATEPKEETVDESHDEAIEPAPAETENEPSEEKTQVDDDAPMESNESAVVDAVVDETAAAKQAKADEAAASVHNQEVEKIVNEKKYFLPIKQAKQARKKQLYVVLVIVLIAALAGGYLLADMGTVKFGFDVPFHILGKKQAVAPVVGDDTPLVTATPATKTQTTTTPSAATTVYTNSTYKFSFSYPKDWGDVTVADNSKATTETGKRLVLAFSKQPLITAGLMSKDWKDTTTDVTARCKQPGFPTYITQKTALDNGLRVTYDGPTGQTYEQLTGGLCDDLELVGQAKFATTSQFSGIEIVYSTKVTDKFDLAQRIADYKKDYNKYFPDTSRQQMITLIKTVVETK